MKNPKLTIVLLFLLTISSCSAEQPLKGNIALNSPSQINYNHLKACPDTPNCINTEYADKISQYIPPFNFAKEKSTQIIDIAKQIIIEMGGEIIVQDNSKINDYLHATFTSSFFKFVDDFEIRIDHSDLKLHIRSASRSGYSDFGVNKRRVKEFYQRLSQ
ncbi:MAG: DUF1499 domain-containing protein, partial [gamma proteobacterium symbiont of Taylorina sp.]|nr:DUF1499 domain-containing protein [gamma proteobacterium symbiont of Taylorina sp.]